MKFKSTLVAAALALSSMGAFAADYSFSDTLAKYFGKLTQGAFSTSITFEGLASGTIYDIDLSLSGTNITFTSGSLDGHALTFDTPAPKVSFGSVSYSGSAPLTLTLTGVAGKKASYSGEISATPVPEPETYAMLLAGLGLVGTIARRRAKKQA